MAQRLKSGCLCDTHQRQTEVLCALDQTPECDIPPCPTVTQPTFAAGVAEAKEAHCTRAPTKSPTKSPTKRPTKSPTAVKVVVVGRGKFCGYNLRPQQVCQTGLTCREAGLFDNYEG